MFIFLDDNYDRENIENQDIIEKRCSEESVNSQALEETKRRGSVSLNVERGNKGNAARWSDDLILRLIDECEARPCLWPGTSCSRDFARATASELSSAITNLFGRLTM